MMAFRRFVQILQYKSTQFGIKLGLVAGTAYYLSDQGIWKDSDTTLQLYDKISTNVSPYSKEITKQIPFEFPSLPKTNELSYVSKYYWNKGVLLTFDFLANIPKYIGEYSSKGFDAFLDNTEVKNIFVSKADT